MDQWLIGGSICQGYMCILLYVTCIGCHGFAYIYAWLEEGVGSVCHGYMCILLYVKLIGCNGVAETYAWLEEGVVMVLHRSLISVCTSSEHMNSYLMSVCTSSCSLHVTVGGGISDFSVHFIWKYELISDVHVHFILFTSSNNSGGYIWSQCALHMTSRPSCALHLKTWPHCNNCFKWALTEDIDQNILDRLSLAVSGGYIWCQCALHVTSWPSCSLHLKTWPNCNDHFEWALSEHIDTWCTSSDSFTGG